MKIIEINKIINDCKRINWNDRERIVINEFCKELRQRLNETSEAQEG